MTNIKLTPTRNEEIDLIIGSLETLTKNPIYKEAAEINIDFFLSAKNPFTYIKWLVRQAPYLRKNRRKIMEISDLPLPDWKKRTHTCLAELERLTFPGLLKPIKKEICSFLNRFDQEVVILLSIGCGVMELERQLIIEQPEAMKRKKIVILGVELAEDIIPLAVENLSELSNNGEIALKKMGNINDLELEKLVAETEIGKPLVAVINIDYLSLAPALREGACDIVYHSRLKHHIDSNKRTEFDNKSIRIGKVVIEFDDFFSLPVFVFPSIITWKWPLTLNGAILSYLRDYSKKEVLSLDNKGWRLKFYNMLGYYLRVYQNEK